MSGQGGGGYSSGKQEKEVGSEIYLVGEVEDAGEGEGEGCERAVCLLALV